MERAIALNTTAFQPDVLINPTSLIVPLARADFWFDTTRIPLDILMSAKVEIGEGPLPLRNDSPHAPWQCTAAFLRFSLLRHPCTRTRRRTSASDHPPRRAVWLG